MWIEITEVDVQGRMAAVELAALKAAATDGGPEDTLPDTISQAVNEVRGYVAASGATLEQGAKVPEVLKAATLAIIRYRVITRVPFNNPKHIETRQREYDDALSLMRRVADGRFAIDVATTPDNTTLPGARGAWGSRPKVEF